MDIPKGEIDRSDPQPGMFLRESDMEMIYEAYALHQERFPETKPVLSMAFVLMNIGDRYSPVECVEGEWKAMRKDVPKRKNPEDPFLCPDGHEIVKTGDGLKLGWIRPVQVVVDEDSNVVPFQSPQENQKG
jgi:hypothetical protein